MFIELFFEIQNSLWTFRSIQNYYTNGHNKLFPPRQSHQSLQLCSSTSQIRKILRIKIIREVNHSTTKLLYVHFFNHYFIYIPKDWATNCKRAKDLSDTSTWLRILFSNSSYRVRSTFLFHYLMKFAFQCIFSWTCRVVNAPLELKILRIISW